MDCFRRLLWQEISPNRDFHAALILTHPREPGATLHQHDFAEMTYILEGVGTHWVNGQRLPLQAGDLLWIRPEDCHTICGRARAGLRYVNVAFSLDVWRPFCAAAALEPAWAAWNAVSLPPSMPVPPAQRLFCAQVFDQIRQVSQSAPTRLDLCRFWSEALPLLQPAEAPAAPVDPDMPLWLTRVRQAMQDPDNLQLGLERLVEISGVSAGHLARTFQIYCGQTPTEFVNALRLERAATLLMTTSQSIVQIAYDCGFDNLSYFYRRFQQRFGKTPRAFRRDGRTRDPLPINDRRG